MLVLGGCGSCRNPFFLLVATGLRRNITILLVNPPCYFPYVGYIMLVLTNKGVVQVATSIFRVEKNREFVVMSNKFLRNKEMSLKAKGLLALCLSLPDNWNYSLNGLCAICKESQTSIRSALKELETFKHLERKRRKDDKGQFVYEYIIYENPYTENLYTVKQHTEKQHKGNNTQQSIKKKSIKKENKDNKLFMDKLKNLYEGAEDGR